MKNTIFDNIDWALSTYEGRYPYWTCDYRDFYYEILVACLEPDMRVGVAMCWLEVFRFGQERPVLKTRPLRNRYIFIAPDDALWADYSLEELMLMPNSQLIGVEARMTILNRLKAP